MSGKVPPENLRYPFGRAIPNNFRWKGRFTTADEDWWAGYGEAMDSFRQQYWQPPPRTGRSA